MHEGRAQRGLPNIAYQDEVKFFLIHINFSILMKSTLLLSKGAFGLRRVSKVITEPWRALVATTLLVLLLGLTLIGLSGFVMSGSNASNNIRSLILTDGWTLIIKVVALLITMRSSLLLIPPNITLFRIRPAWPGVDQIRLQVVPKRAFFLPFVK